MSILLADDDVHLATFLSKSLESEGYSVHTALDEDSVLAELRRQNYQLIILDLNFGQTDGLKLLEKLRTEGLATPVLILSARNQVSDRIQSLNLGADDYVTKPFSFQELAARANAVMRRKADPSLNVLRVEDLETDPALRRVTRGEREIKLSPKEFDLLHLLMRRAGQTVSRQELLQQAWGLQPETDSNLVDVYVNYLRKKIDLASEEKLICTVRGSGYRLGPVAPTSANSPDAAKTVTEQPQSGKTQIQTAHLPGPVNESQMIQQTPLRALVSSVAHDLAQPLTSVRCFLEVVAMRGGTAIQTGDIKNIEQQADRAIALTKTIASLVREIPAPSGPWISLNLVLQEVFNDFIVLLHSGMLTLDRQWDPSIQITSSPVLRQLLVLLAGKIVGKNTRPLTLSATTSTKGNRCRLELHWKGIEPGAVQDSRSVLGKELVYVQELAYSIGGELSFAGDSTLALELPAAPHTAFPGRQEMLQ
ncbi:MAG TPA: response regulator [Candidatus Saccharimonadales bacterium]|jgi:DNA-binding response OmpR family regulator|nr:response regulator [Candidatus Saccharimonadales bacterium]